MVVIKGVTAKSILDSRKEKTILVSIRTNAGNFSASAPNGKSRGRYEAKPYKNSLEEDIKTLRKFSDYFSKEIIEKFEDLRRVEDIVDRHVGANTLFAFESAVLKAVAKEKKKEIWQVINPNTIKSPRLIGNCIGGGKHSDSEKKPDFQEFLLIPDLKSAKKASEANKKAKEEAEKILKESEPNFKGRKNDENAWITSMNEKEVLEVLKKISLPLGVDVAASGFCKRKKYNYKNPPPCKEQAKNRGIIFLI